jgi:hypothetical protein
VLTDSVYISMVILCVAAAVKVSDLNQAFILKLLIIVAMSVFTITIRPHGWATGLMISAWFVARSVPSQKLSNRFLTFVAILIGLILIGRQVLHGSANNESPMQHMLDGDIISGYTA